MNSRNLTFFWAFILLFAACATQKSVRHGFTEIPTLAKQCEILGKKREVVRIKKSKRKLTRSTRNQPAVFESQLISSNQEPAENEPLLILPINPANPTDESLTTESDEINNTEFLLPADSSNELRSASFQTQQKWEVERNQKSSESLPILVQQEPIIEKGIESDFIPVLIGGSGALSLLLLCVAQRRSRQISLWAAQNPWKSRGIITGTHIATGIGALALGNNLAVDGMIISETAKYMTISATAVSVCLYPLSQTTNYIHRKMYDVALFTSGVIMLAYIGNHYEIRQQQNPTNAIYSFASSSNENQWYLAKTEVSIPKIKEQDPPKKRSTGVKILLTLLAVAGLVGLGILLAALSCTLACNGSEALAGIVGIGGGVGLIIGFIAVIKSIFGKKRKKKTEIPQPQAYNL